MKIPAGLNQEILADLYLRQLKTEKEIAERFGTYQVRVNRLRAKWGIPTLDKTGRMSALLPLRLSSVQEQVLIGSLLGDGTLGESSVRTAVFSEGHCMEQASYTEWKAQIFEPFTTSIYPICKRDAESGRVFHGRAMRTHACEVLRPYFDLFYPAPNWKRVFSPDLSERMTPLVLAVWYMDDGSLTVRGAPRIHFGIGQTSLDRGLAALRVLGLRPRVYGMAEDCTIVFPFQALEFGELVKPFLLPCFKYKVPWESPRQISDRNARSLTPELARELSRSGESVFQIAQQYHVGRSTVKRRLEQW